MFSRAPIDQWLPFRMDLLAAGALLALLWPELRLRIQTSEFFRRSTIGLGGSAMVLGFAALLVLHHHGITITSYTPMGNALLFSLTVIMMSGAVLLALMGVGRRILSSWPLVWLGRISFSMYLIHLTALHFAPKHNPWIALVMSLAYSTAMWFFVEKPIITPGASKEKVLVAQDAQH